MESSWKVRGGGVWAWKVRGKFGVMWAWKVRGKIEGKGLGMGVESSGVRVLKVLGKFEG